MKLCIQIFLCFSLSLANATENPSIAYINKYKDLAISEMERTGIPASIKLAQALLESGAGKSTLAREAKNHFGIKCNGGWTGDTYHHKDDDYKNGKLIKSCFRKFNNVSESFYEHSEFLKGQKRYAFLFHLSNKDYHGWAHGLKKAGYATDKAYPTKLINLIDKYQLFLYDDGPVSEEVLASTEMPDPVILAEHTVPAESASRSGTSSRRSSSRTSRTKSNRSTRHRSSRRSSKKKKSIKDLFKKKNKRESSSAIVFHIVRAGESLADISRKHDLDEAKLRLRNRIPKDAEPLVGEKIYLRKRISTINRPEFTRIANNRSVASQDEYIF